VAAVALEHGSFQNLQLFGDAVVIKDARRKIELKIQDGSTYDNRFHECPEQLDGGYNDGLS
jgi:hypothetical protein